MPNTDSEYHRDSDWNILARIEKKLTNRPVRICTVVDFMCKQMYLLMNATRYVCAKFKVARRELHSYTNTRQVEVK